MVVTEEIYRRWLKAAYAYYWGDGGTMHDSEWDHIASHIDPEQWDELRGTGYVPGESLYWMAQDQYPDWAKEA